MRCGVEDDCKEGVQVDLESDVGQEFRSAFKTSHIVQHTADLAARTVFAEETHSSQ